MCSKKTNISDSLDNYTEIIINHVKRIPYLYDKNLEPYHNSELKDKAYAEITAEINSKLESTKTMFTSNKLI